MKLINKKTAKYTRFALSYFFIIVMLFVIFLPIVFTLIYSVQPGDNPFVSEFSLEGATLEHYRTLFDGSTHYLTWYKTTLVAATLTVIIQLAVTTLAAFAFSRYKFFGKQGTLRGLILIQMIPNIVALPVFYILAVTFNMQNVVFLALIYSAGAIPMNTLLLKGYFDSVPKELDKCAKIDGASDFYTLKNVIIPLSKPIIVVMAIWAFMGPFSDYMTPKFLFTAVEDYTIAAGLQTLISDPKNASYTLYAAGSVLTAIPVVILFYYVQKDLVSNLLKGSVKG